MEFLKILLDPDQETSGAPLVDPVEKKTDSAAELEQLRISVAKLEEVVKKERELKDEADRKAREAAKAAADAGKTAEERYADQMRELAEGNAALRLEVGRERAVRDALSKIDSEGFEVDMAKLTGLLSVTAMSADNVGTVVNTVVESLKRPKTQTVATQNNNQPVQNRPQLAFGQLQDDALTAPWQGKQPDLTI